MVSSISGMGGIGPHIVKRLLNLSYAHVCVCVCAFHWNIQTEEVKELFKEDISKVFNEMSYLLNPWMKVTPILSRNSHSATHQMCGTIQHGMLTLSLKSQILLSDFSSGLNRMSSLGLQSSLIWQGVNIHGCLPPKNKMPIAGTKLQVKG